MSSASTEEFELSPSQFIQIEFTKTWQWRIDTDPELAASLGLLFERRSKHVLDPRSLQSFQNRLNWVDAALCRIKTGITQTQIDNDLSKDEQLSLELYIKQLTDYVTYTRNYKGYLVCVNRLEGPTN